MSDPEMARLLETRLSLSLSQRGVNKIAHTRRFLLLRPRGQACETEMETLVFLLPYI